MLRLRGTLSFICREPWTWMCKELAGCNGWSVATSRSVFGLVLLQTLSSHWLWMTTKVSWTLLSETLSSGRSGRLLWGHHLSVNLLPTESLLGRTLTEFISCSSTGENVLWPWMDTVNESFEVKIKIYQEWQNIVTYQNAAFWYMYNTHSHKQVLPTKIFFSANFFMPDSLSASVPSYTDCILNVHCISLHPLVSDHSSTTQRTILHLNNYNRQVQQLCLLSVNTLSTYSMHLNRFWGGKCLGFFLFFSQKGISCLSLFTCFISL